MLKRAVRAIRGKLGLPSAEDRARARFYAQFVKPGELAFDVGANVGTRVDALLRIGARVVAVEPQAECVRRLEARFGSDDRFVLVAQAVGASPGSVSMFVGSESLLASASPAWIEAVRASARFGEHEWRETREVPMTTIDALIAAHGRPVFVKIDVEGYEREVLRGLSEPVRSLSFEFTPETFDDTRACVEYVDGLGMREFNYSLGESMELARASWTDASTVLAELSAFRGDVRVFGDVYARTSPGGSRGP